jgi:hypothetical protein
VLRGSAEVSGMSLCYLFSAIVITIDCALFFRSDALRMRASIPAAKEAI